MTRDNMIKKFGLDIVLSDEKLWLSRGFLINYKTGLLEPNDRMG